MLQGDTVSMLTTEEPSCPSLLWSIKRTWNESHGQSDITRPLACSVLPSESPDENLDQGRTGRTTHLGSTLHSIALRSLIIIALVPCTIAAYQV